MTDRAQKRIDLGNELGLTRRDLLRRGAIVGGTLLWAAPVVQSIAKPAFANTVAGSARYYCCYCWRRAKQGGIICSCAANGAPPLVPNNDADCVAMCRSQGYSNHDFDSGLHSCSCGSSPCTPCSCN
jgi:hypothetical protein